MQKILDFLRRLRKAVFWIDKMRKRWKDKQTVSDDSMADGPSHKEKKKTTKNRKTSSGFLFQLINDCGTLLSHANTESKKKNPQWFDAAKLMANISLYFSGISKLHGKRPLQSVLQPIFSPNPLIRECMLFRLRYFARELCLRENKRFLRRWSLKPLEIASQQLLIFWFHRKKLLEEK